MNQAQKFIKAWGEQTKTIDAKSLARQLFPKVMIERSVGPLSFKYLFEDGSKVKTTGTGSSFNIKEINQVLNFGPQGHEDFLVQEISNQRTK